MLDSLRAAVNSWPAKILLGLILLSFIAWGGHSAFQAGSDNTLLTSGKATVSAPDYELALRNETLRLSMRLGHYLTPAESAGYGLRQAVFGQVYRNVALDNAATAMKLGASDKSAADLLSRDPLFHNAAGQFDRSAFDFYLQQMRVSQDEFVDSFYVSAARRDQIADTITGGADAPNAFYKALSLYMGQTRAVNYAELAPEPLNTIVDPDEKTLAGWYEAHLAQFRTPEYRQIDYISLMPQDLAKADAVSDEDAAAYYKAHADKYLISPERRSFALLHFADKNAANAALTEIEAAIKGGASAKQAFAAYKNTHNGLKAEQKTNIARADLPSALGGEVFALPQTGLSSVISDLSGSSLALLTNITPAQSKPLALVSAQIKQDIALAQAQSALPELRKKIEDTRYDGANLAEIAGQYHLALHKITADENGLTPQGQNAGFPQAGDLLKNVFTTPENTDTDPLNLAGGGYVWFNVNEIIPPHNSDLGTVRAKAVAAWKQEQQRQRLDSRAADLARQLNAGADFAALAKQQNLTMRHETALRRDSKNKMPGQQAVAAIFAAAKGESGFSLSDNADTRIVFRVEAITEPQNAGRDSFSAVERDNIAQLFGGDLLASYIGAQVQIAPVLINSAVYKRLNEDDNN